MGLYTDQYELTMLEGALKSGAAERRSLFEVFARSLPDGRRYGIVAGTGRFLDELAEYRFGDEELAWLRDNDVVDGATLDWLADYEFDGIIHGYAEGDAFFPGSPILTVESSFASGVVLETLALSILNHDSAVASAASRMTTAAAGRPCLEMGSRRTHEEAAVAAARAAVIGGFFGTSNMEAGRRYGLTTLGTSAHAFTLLHDTEEEAFAAQVKAHGPSTTLLVDTYDVTRGVDRAVRAAGTGLGGVRLDSGDLLTQARDVRAQLDSLGATATQITVTSDLDEYAIAGLAAAPVDSYGVGTSLVTGSGFPTVGLVYKLVARQNDDGDWVSVAKASTNKASVGGRKFPVRRIGDDGHATGEIVGVGAPPEITGESRDLQVRFVSDGRIDKAHTGPDAVTAAAARRAASIDELPDTAHKLQRGEPAIDTAFVAER